MYTHAYSHTKPCKNYLAERGLILSPVYHWEPLFVFALFSPQRCKCRWEIARQESNLMTNTRAILGYIINVVQLYHSSFMTMHSAACSGFPSQAAFWGRCVGQESVFRHYQWWIPDFSRKHFKALPRQVKAAGNIKICLCSFQGANSTCLQKFAHTWKSRNMLFLAD